jgi:fucose permease
MFALGLVVVGVLAPSFAGAGQRHAVFTAALCAMGGGAALLSAVLTPALSLLGALAMGAGAALIVALVPAFGIDVRGGGAASLLARANALSSAAGLLAPLLVAAAIAIGAGWQTGYLILPLLAALLVLIALRARALPDATTTAPNPRSASRPAATRLWISLVLAISVEFCMVFWAASYLHSNLSLRTATATALAGAFLVGMALGRASVDPVMRLVLSAEATVRLAVGVALAGFIGFWLADVAWLATVGLAVTGLGVALLYPLTVARYIAASPTDSTRSSSRAALASGLAIGVAPIILAIVSDRVGLHRAYLLVPVLCALLIGNSLRKPPPLVLLED